MKTLDKEAIKEFVLKNPQYYNYSIKEAKLRTGLDTNDITELNKFYIDAYEPLNEEEFKVLVKYIKEADEKVKKIVSRVGLQDKNIEWKFIKMKKGTDWNFPNTKADVIILPQSAFKEPKQLFNTLVHEKLHIYQRKFPKVFTKYYADKYQFKPLILNDEQLESISELNIEDIIVNNPDTTDMGLMIFRNQIIPIPVIIEGRQYPVLAGLYVKGNKIMFTTDMSKYQKIFNVAQTDHPNEIFACKFAY